MIRLYDYELSGNCYKVRLLCGFLDLPFVSVPIEFHPGREHKSRAFLRINPMGQMPVIDDDGFILRDAQAILTYIAARYDPSHTWCSTTDARLLGEIFQWLAFADSITATASAARLHDSFFYDLDVEAARAGAHRLFRIIDAHLWFAEQEGRGWLCSALYPTIADIACFPYIILSEEGGIFLQDYPALRRWCDRVKRIPGFVAMPGVFPAGPKSSVV